MSDCIIINFPTRKQPDTTAVDDFVPTCGIKRFDNDDPVYFEAAVSSLDQAAQLMEAFHKICARS